MKFEHSSNPRKILVIEDCGGMYYLDLSTSIRNPNIVSAIFYSEGGEYKFDYNYTIVYTATLGKYSYRLNSKWKHYSMLACLVEIKFFRLKHYPNENVLKADPCFKIGNLIEFIEKELY